MDFRFDDDQLALRDAMRSFCKSHLDLDTVARRADTWRALADVGMFSLLLAGADGGLGAVEAAIVFEQLGAHLVPGPVLWSTISAPFVPEVATGVVRVTGAEVPSRMPLVVDHAAEADAVMIVYDDRIERCDASVLPELVAGEPFDPLTPAASYEALPHGAVVGRSDDVRRLRVNGTVLASAMLVGVAQGALDVASSYALERHQFGVPIGSFQAIKHLLADMYVRTELARSATYAAAAIFDDPRAGEPMKAASTAKLLAGEAAIANGRAAVQVLGGMGFTWEMLPHYYLKRAWVLEQSFGTGDMHALGLSAALGAEPARWT